MQYKRSCGDALTVGSCTLEDKLDNDIIIEIFCIALIHVFLAFGMCSQTLLCVKHLQECQKKRDQILVLIMIEGK